MSMSLYVYVGPYLKAMMSTADIYDLHNGNLMSVDNDSNEHITDSAVYCIPNMSRPGEPDRQTDFERTDVCPVIEMADTLATAEKEWFASAFASEITPIMAADDTASIGWGVVPYWN